MCLLPEMYNTFLQLILAFILLILNNSFVEYGYFKTQY